MTDAGLMDEFNDGEHIHFPIPVDKDGNGPLDPADPAAPPVDHYVCFCGGPYPCPRENP